MDTQKKAKREALIIRAIEVLNETNWQKAKEKLTQAFNSGYKIELKSNNEEDKTIFNVFRALNIPHAYLIQGGLVYMLK